MNSLHELHCEACRTDAACLAPERYDDYLPALPGWRIVEDKGIDTLEKTFRFSDFRRAMAFAARVSELAETEGHHPALLVEWGKVTVSWWTHKLGGLHTNDFIMAARTDTVVTR